MKVLLLGGTGILSAPIYELCVAKGHDTYVLNRGKRPYGAIPTDRILIADLRVRRQVEAAVGNKYFDAVVDFLTYTPEHLKSTLSIFQDKTEQYVFISSATAYDTNATHIICEDTPLVISGWSYAVEKARCEHLLREMAQKANFRYTIIRPYVTYGNTRIPFALCSRAQQWSVANRIITNKPVLLWDDGKAFRPFTHTSDFAIGVVGLLGNPLAYEEAFHITSDAVYCWNDVVNIIGDTLGKKPTVFYVPTVTLEKEFPAYGHELSGDKAKSFRFDNSKIKATVPEYHSCIILEEGLKRTLAFYQAHPEMQLVDAAWDGDIDRVITKYATHYGDSVWEAVKTVAIENPTRAERNSYYIHRHIVLFSVYRIVNSAFRFMKSCLRRLLKAIEKVQGIIIKQ